MKLKTLLVTLTAGLMLIGCTPSNTPQVPTKSYKKSILGSWHTSKGRHTRDGGIISTRSTETFYRNGTLKSTMRIDIHDARRKNIGASVMTRYFKWSIKGNRLTTRFKSCRNRVIRRPRNSKAEIFNDFIKLVCKYANKRGGGRGKTRSINYINPHTLSVDGNLFTR